VWEEGKDGASASELRKHIQKRLPEYMVPGAFVTLAELPLTGNGKLDRKALPSPEESTPKYFSRRDPRDNIELQLKHLWETTLNKDNVGIDENFFDIGGNSLNAVMLAARMAKAFSGNISVKHIFATPTVEGLASLLRSQADLRTASTIVPINARGDEEPLFLVHPVSGIGTCYVPLSRSFGNRRPLYAFQSCGLSAGESPLTSIEQMASLYVNDMKKVRPAGPYLLGGWSFGSIVAYEMAQQLSRQGEQVSSLIILDGAPSSLNGKCPEGMEVSVLKAQYLQDRILEAGLTAANGDASAIYLSYLKEKGLCPQDLSLSLYDRFLNVIAANMHAYRRYRCHKYAASRAIVLTSSDSEDPTASRWSKLIDEMSKQGIDAPHSEFVLGSNADKVASLLEEMLHKQRTLQCFA
jgi:thioesterase domain-containing protein/acyl carrier protein